MRSIEELNLPDGHGNLEKFILPTVPENLFPDCDRSTRLLMSEQLCKLKSEGLPYARSALLWLNSNLVASLVEVRGSYKTKFDIQRNNDRLADQPVIDTDDLMQVGLIELFRLLKTWNYEKGSLSAYAFPLIRYAMLKEVAVNGPYLSHPLSEAFKIEADRRTVNKPNNLQGTPAGLSESFASKFQTVPLNFKMDVAPEETSSEFIGEEQKLVPDLSLNEESSTQDIEEIVTNKHFAEWLLNQLDATEQKIIKMRLGFNKKFYTFGDIGKSIGGISRQAVEQKYKKIIKKLKIHCENIVESEQISMSPNESC